MKKVILLVCIFSLFLFALFPVASAQTSDGAPSKTAINRAVSWAQSLVGKKSFPYFHEDGGIGKSPSLMQCARFVSNSYEGTSSYTASILWFTSYHQHPGDWNAPRGSLVFFQRTYNNSLLGHVALSTGNGNIIEAGDHFIKKSTIIDENRNAPYLGWAWPPSDWPGRSGNSMNPIALTMAFVTLSTAVFFIVRSRKLKKPGVPK